MAAKKIAPKEIGETLGYIVEHMATKDDIAGLDTRIERLGAKLESVETNLSAKITASTRNSPSSRKGKSTGACNWKFG